MWSVKPIKAIHHPASDWLQQDTLVLASNNTGKIAELQHLFRSLGLPITVVAQRQFGIADALENGLSFVENAILKARHAAQHAGKPALADDSGLCVPLLNGAPGISSARYAGEHGNDMLNNQKLLADLKPFRTGQPIGAYFVCVLALVQHPFDPLPLIFQGIWHGHILEQPRGNGGFGYDPLFYLPQLGKSSAELSAHEKNTISHRAQAMQSLAKCIARMD